MNCKAKFNYWVDVFFLVTLVVVIFTGLLLWGWIRPQGAPGGSVAPSGGQGSARQSASASPGDRDRGGERQGGDATHRDGGQASGPGGGPQMGEAKIFWGLLKGRAFWGLNKKQWENVHAWVSVAMCVFFICHLVMHFSWLISSTKRLSAGSSEAIIPNLEEKQVD